MAAVVDEEQLEAIPFYLLMINESTDISTGQKLIMYCISSIKRLGVYFFRGEIYPAFKRGRRLYGAGVYSLR